MLKKGFIIACFVCFCSWNGFGPVQKDSILLEKHIGEIMEQADQDLDKSFRQMSSLKKKVEIESSTFIKAMVYNCLGDLYCDKGVIDSALFYIEKAIDLRLLMK